MDHEPSNDVREKMRALCGQISVARDLDAEIQRELYDHMEDKLLAYLSGDEPVTEQDAFILVREHFGDPAAIKACLHETHTVAAGVSVGRRLTAALTVWVLGAFASVGTIKLVGLLFLFPTHFVGIIQVFLLLPVLLVLQPWVMYCIFRRWQERIERQQPVWFYRMSVQNLTLVAAGMAALSMILPFLNDNYPYDTGIDARYAVLLTMISGIGNFLVQAALWFWWCDRPPRSARALDYATAALLAFVAASVLMSLAIDSRSWTLKAGNVLPSMIFFILLTVGGRGVYRLALRFWKRIKSGTGDEEAAV